MVALGCPLEPVGTCVGDPIGLRAVGVGVCLTVEKELGASVGCPIGVMV